MMTIPMINPGRPTILSRSAWDALDARAQDSCVRPNSTDRIVIHHCGDTNDNWAQAYPTDESYMKRVQEYQMNDVPTTHCDIAYHYGVGIHGKILDGRLDMREGSHVKTNTPYSNTSIGIIVHGNFNYRTLTTGQENSLVDLVAWLCYTYQIDPTDENICGHKDAPNNSTDCPGANLYSSLPRIRGKVLEKLVP